MVFRLPFGPNNEHGGNFKGGCPLFNGGSKGAVPPHCPCNLVGSWDIFFTEKPDIVGVAGANMQFSLPQLQSKKRENTAFELVQWNDWGLSSPSKQVGRCSTSCWKRAKFGVEEVNSGQNICSRDTSVGNIKNFEKQVSPLRVN